MCYVDFKKAFDSVNHSLLWTKICQIGISHQMLRILQSIYATTKSCVEVSNNCATSYFHCHKGVRQGCNLSPLRFSLFTSSLETILKTNMSGVELTTSGRVLDLLMYADEIVLISSSATGLKKHLHTLQSFCKDWKLNMNTDKTKVCVFGRDRGCQPFLWNGTILEKDI